MMLAPKYDPWQRRRPIMLRRWFVYGLMGLAIFLSVGWAVLIWLSISLGFATPFTTIIAVTCSGANVYLAYWQWTTRETLRKAGIW